MTDSTVYAIFNCDVLIIDVAKRNALQEQLLRGLTTTKDGETLDQKLAAAMLEQQDISNRKSAYLMPSSLAFLTLEFSTAPKFRRGSVVGYARSATFASLYCSSP